MTEGRPFEKIDQAVRMLKIKGFSIFHILFLCLLACAPACITISDKSQNAADDTPEDEGDVSTGLTDLEVPIEMLAIGASSRTGGGGGPQIFERSKTNIDATAYDGTVTYSFETVAQNGDSVDHDVMLVDSAGTVIATHAYTALTTTPKRMRVAFTPTQAGLTHYHLKLGATTAANDVRVFAARILIKQVGATKTKVYVPLVQATQSTYTNVDYDSGGTSATDGRLVNTYGQNATFSYAWWRYTAANWDGLAAGTPFELESLTYTAATNTTSIALFNQTTNTMVADSEETGDATGALQFISKTFAANATDFDDDDVFEIRLKSDDNTNRVTILKSGLWITLDQIVKGEVTYRCGSNVDNSVARGFVSYRLNLNKSSYTTGATYFEATLNKDGSTTVDLNLRDCGTSAGVAAGSCTAVAGSTVTWSGARELQRSGAINLTDGNEYLVFITPTGGTTTSDVYNVHCVVTFDAD